MSVFSPFLKRSVSTLLTRRAPLARRFSRGFVTALGLVTLSVIATAHAQTVPSTPNLYFQTSGRERAANIGDWYTTKDSSSTDRIHRFFIEVTQEQLTDAGGSVMLTVNDPKSHTGGIDEVGGGASDPTRFAVCSARCTPGNASDATVLKKQTFDSSSPDTATFTYTFTSAGVYQLTSETGAFPISGTTTTNLNDDDNSFTFSVSSGSFPLVVGQSQSSIQQSVQQTINLYFFVPVGTTGPLQLRNFDIDNNASAIEYIRPDGTTVSGTGSGNGNWNGGGNLNSGADSVPINNSYGWWTMRISSLTAGNQLVVEANDGAGDRLPLVFMDVADVSLAKSVDKATPVEGSEVVYTMTVTNTGPGTAPSVTVKDSFPAGLTVLSTSGCEGTTGVPSCFLGTLAPGSSKSFTVRARVSSGTAGSTVTNNALVTFNGNDRNTANNRASASVRPVAPPNPSLSVSKTADKSGAVAPGDTLTYTVNVTNTGNVPLPGVNVSDAVPAGTTYVANSAQVTAPPVQSGTVRDEFTTSSYSGNNGTTTWSGAWTELGESDGVSAGVVRVGANASCAAGTCLTFDAQNVALGNRGLRRGADLSGAASATLSFSYRRRAAGATGIVYLEVSPNGGSSWQRLAAYPLNADDGAQIAQSFDVGAYASSTTQIRFIGQGSASGVPSSVTRQMFIDDVQISFKKPGTPVTAAGSAPPTLASGHYLAVGASVKVSFQVKVNASPTVTKIENIASAVSDQTVSKSSSPAVNPVAVNADLSLSKTVDKPYPVPKVGATTSVVYSVTVTNAGPLRATGVAVGDVFSSLPAGVTVDAANVSVSGGDGGETCTVSGVNVTCTLGAVAVGAAETINIPLVITYNRDLFGVSINNTAQVTAADQSDPNSAPNNNVATEDDQASLTVNISGLKLSKSVCKLTSEGACDAAAAFSDTATQALSVSPGEVLVYRVAYKLFGPRISDAVLSDTVPSYTALVRDVYPNSSEVRLVCPNGTVVYLEAGVSEVRIDFKNTGVEASCGLSSPGVLAPNATGEARFQVRVQ